MRKVIFALALFVGACNSQLATSSGDAEAVAQASAAWDAAYSSGDMAALIDRYEPDAVSMPPGGLPLEGRASIGSDFASFFDSNTAVHQTLDADRRISGELAVERARYELTITPRNGDQPIHEAGKHLVVYHRDETGTWRVLWEIWNTSG